MFTWLPVSSLGIVLFWGILLYVIYELILEIKRLIETSIYKDIPIKIADKILAISPDVIIAI